MLLTFSVTNYKGIKNKQVLDLVATSKGEYPKSLFPIDDNVRVNKSACIIGPNGSGKTNLFEAMIAFKNAVDDAKNIAAAYQPFNLDDCMLSKPTEYEVLLYDKKAEEYINYYFSTLSGKVLEERLDVKKKRKNGRTQNIFTRKNNKIKFSSEYQSEQNLLDGTLSDGGLILNFSSSTSINIPHMKFISQWIKTVLMFNPSTFRAVSNGILTSIVEFYSATQELEKNEVIDNINENTLINLVDLLGKLDLPIVKLKVELSEKGETFLLITPKSNSKSQREYTMSEAKDFFSLGTFNTLNMLLTITFISNISALLLIDEYDGSLHHKLSLGVLDYIRKTIYAQSTAQVLMSTHDVLLLDNEFRRDSIFIFKKDEELSTVISKASDFAVRKDAKMSLKYLSDEFGALPNILSGE